MKFGDLWVRIYAGMTGAERAAVAELEWKARMRARFGDTADSVIERADELSLTTTIPRGEARAQAEFEQYAAEFRSFGSDKVSNGVSTDD